MNQRSILAARGERRCVPLAFGWVPENGRDHAESRKPLVRMLDALVFVRAVAMIASGWAQRAPLEARTAAGDSSSCTLSRSPAS